MSGSMMKKEFMTPDNAGSEVIASIKERLMTNAARLTCMNCGATLRVTAERSKNIVGCHKCGSTLMAPLPPGDMKTRMAVEKGLKKKKLNDDEKKRYKASMLAAQLFSQYGYRAVLCMAARGVGPTIASRILQTYFEDDEELVKKIFGEEVKYARTKRFWD
jgi:ATP-dependent Lhr-like helicase